MTNREQMIEKVAEALAEAYRHPAAMYLDAAERVVDAMAKAHCAARHPSNASIVPCMLPVGHDSRAPHWSTSGCAGGACEWFDENPDHWPGRVMVDEPEVVKYETSQPTEVVDLVAALRATVEAARARRLAAGHE